MTYADMITLLLCFFAVFLFASVALTHKKEEPPPQAQVESPPPPIAGQETLPPQIAPRLEVQEPPPPPELIGNLPFHDPSFPLAGEVKEEAAPAPLPPPPPVPEEPEQKEKGDKITIMEMNSSTSFERGSATLNEAGKAVLKDVFAKIQTESFKDYQITVEGHTDDTPIKTVQFPSNWELSTARASAVVHFFIEQGIAPQRLRAAGYADTFPKLPNKDADGHPLPDNQAQNRRVVIKLEKIEKM